MFMSLAAQGATIVGIVNFRFPAESHNALIVTNSSGVAVDALNVAVGVLSGGFGSMTEIQSNFVILGQKAVDFDDNTPEFITEFSNMMTLSSSPQDDSRIHFAFFQGATLMESSEIVLVRAAHTFYDEHELLGAHIIAPVHDADILVGKKIVVEAPPFGVFSRGVTFAVPEPSSREVTFAVPEPSSVILVGMSSVFGFARRRK
ncbi:PEP-CTERM sorting domain-containing protein [Akkermansiaceae bacterium]|nr:PEP-CTERM sorting domain-containing protein [Akkermansiaceae bacterium]